MTKGGAFFIIGLSALAVHHFLIAPTLELDSLESQAEIHDTAPPETVKQMARFLETDANRLTPRISPEQSPSPFPPSGRIELTDAFSSEEAKNRFLAQFSNDPKGLMEAIDQKIRSADENHFSDKIYFLNFAAELDGKIPNAVLQQFFLDQADENFSSHDFATNDYGKRAFFLYLNTEPNLEIRIQKEQDFLAKHPIVEDFNSPPPPDPTPSP